MLALGSGLELDQAGKLLPDLGARSLGPAGIEQPAAGGVFVLPLFVQPCNQRITVKLQHYKALAGKLRGGAHQLDLPGQRQVDAVQLQPAGCGQVDVSFDHGALHAGGQHRVGLGLFVGGKQHVVVQRGGHVGAAGGKLPRQHGRALLFTHAGQGQHPVVELAAAHRQRHTLGGQLVGGKKALQRSGQLGLVGDDAVDQAALRQFGLAGRRDFGPIRRR